MSVFEIIDLTPENIPEYGVCGYKDAAKNPGLAKKIEWVKEHHPKGLRIKALISQSGGYQGMIEYIPGEFAHRPVDAAGYLFIHCLFVGFKKEFKGRGFASALINECLQDARRQGLYGVAAVARKGSFMAGKEIFLKNRFVTVDKTKPDFELMVYRLNDQAPLPGFKPDMQKSLQEYGQGLLILRSSQCPYTERNVAAIAESANNLKLQVKVLDLQDVQAVQDGPCPFGSFCLIHDGEIISYHPISDTRFKNIMKKRLGA